MIVNLGEELKKELRARESLQLRQSQDIIIQKLRQQPGEVSVDCVSQGISCSGSDIRRVN